MKSHTKLMSALKTRSRIVCGTQRSLSTHADPSLGRWSERPTDDVEIFVWLIKILALQTLRLHNAWHGQLVKSSWVRRWQRLWSVVCIFRCTSLRAGQWSRRGPFCNKQVPPVCSFQLRRLSLQPDSTSLWSVSQSLSESETIIS